MLVKATCHGSTFEIARRKVLRALIEFRIRGVKTSKHRSMSFVIAFSLT